MSKNIFLYLEGETGERQGTVVCLSKRSNCIYPPLKPANCPLLSDKIAFWRQGLVPCLPAQWVLKGFAPYLIKRADG